jgi:hypothetical protein
MSMDPGAMQQLLSQQLQQPQGAGGPAPQMQGSTATPVGIGAQVMQKLMLMKALQGQPPQPQLPGMPPPIQQANPALQQTNPMMQQQPLPGAQNV